MLKYLFTAEFANGDLFDQNEEDKSLIDPDKRSSFFDVMERVKTGKPEDKLIGFHLVDPINKTQLSVNLINGLFYLDGFPMNVSDEYNHLELGELTDYTVIYFRKHREHINRETGKIIASELTFRMGWKAKDKNGNVVQRVIEIA